ncbi:uncharacterized protein LOC132197540 isoform X2 [Neocloeon triangulifer]|uniref:uncharacterized protein LOC132197540 isoform X2 n=1 Tax=Neocloeon triangulifer TaxID=2078957 RepID=UPI00286F7670|nr:uncharacterized protein LOC132197540 isoform X2 [Neocloeon triangulifer]
MNSSFGMTLVLALAISMAERTISIVTKCNANSSPFIHAYTSTCISKCLGLVDEINLIKCQFNRNDGQLKLIRTFCTSSLPKIVLICGKRMTIGLTAEGDESDFFFFPSLVLYKPDVRMWEPKGIDEIKCILEEGLTPKQLTAGRVWIAGYKPACRNAPNMTYELNFCSQKFSKPFVNNLLPWAPPTTNLTDKNVCVNLVFRYNITTKSTSEYAYREVDCDNLKATIVHEYLRAVYRPPLQ